MSGLFRASVVLLIVSSSVLAADDKQAKDSHSKTGPVIVTKVDAEKGTFTVKYTDDKGKAQEKTFTLTKDVRMLDETGRVANLAVFESGDEVLLVETEGQLHEVRRTNSGPAKQRVSDTVKTLIEMADGNQTCVEDLQAIYDTLRKLDTGKSGKIDPAALKAEADQIIQERVKKAFTRLDTDKNGKISKEEARGLIKEHFDKIDANKDGSIEFDELLQAARERHEQKASGAQATSDKQKEQK